MGLAISGIRTKSQKACHIIFAKMDNDEANTSSTKRILRRDTERQRRQQMAILNASLRSVLPIEMIKGKRSISDHIHGAVNYIEYLKHKIAHLSIRRDKLLESPNSSVLALGNERSGKYVLNRAMVHPCSGGVEIVIITSNADEEVLLLSEVLEILLEEGFCVVTCVSTKANESLLYSIKAKVNHFECLDLPGLQRKLNDLIF